MVRILTIALAAVFSFALIQSAPIASAVAQNGQTPAQAQNGGIVAVLDLAKVFELHPGHIAKMAQIQKRAEAMKIDFQQQQITLQEKAKQATTQYKGEQLNGIEVTLRQEEVTLQTKARQAQTELMKSEAEAYYQTYEEVMGHVKSLCTQYNVSLVLRYDSEPIDPSKPETVIRGVQRSVVHATQDLTPLVVGKVGGVMPPANTTAAAGAGAGAGVRQ